MKQSNKTIPAHLDPRYKDKLNDTWKNADKEFKPPAFPQKQEDPK